MMTDEERRALVRHMLGELEAAERSLSTWELDFLESVTTHFRIHGDVTQKQYEKLCEIYEERGA